MHCLRLRTFFVIVACAAAVMAAGCGEGSAYSPTAPSAVPGSSALSEVGSAGDVIPIDVSATLASKDGDGGHGNKEKEGKREDGEDHDDTDGERGHRGQLSGFVTAVGPSSIVVRGVTVQISDTTVIRHGYRTLAIGDIHVGDHAQARGRMDNGVLLASEIKVEDTGRGDDDDEDGDLDEAEIRGTVSGLTGSCATGLTFMVGSTKVTTNGSTKYEGITCSALANGAAVEVEGIAQTDGSILAAEIEQELDEIEGTVSGLTGSCATGLTFMVETTKVTTSAATTFEDLACASLANGASVEVKGTRLADSSIAATKVELD